MSHISSFNSLQNVSFNYKTSVFYSRIENFALIYVCYKACYEAYSQE